MMRIGAPPSRRRMTLLSAGLLSLCLAGLPASAAAAKKKHRGYTVKVKTGTLTLTFTSVALKSIDSGSATVGTVTTPVAPATSATAGVFTFPLTKGTLNSATGYGTLAAQGGLTIESHLNLAGLFESSSTASAANPSASLGRSSLLSLTSANFTPSTVAFFTLSLAHLKVTGSRHSVTISRIPALLTAPGAQFFGGSFKEKQQIATVTIQAKD
jgi:hypothetical protein